MPEKFNIPKYSQVTKFHVSNFRCFDYPRKFFNSEFLPIYGMWGLYYHLYIHGATKDKNLANAYTFNHPSIIYDPIENMN